MKHISEIYLNNVKGVTGTFKLSPLTVIVGDNESGKSALLDGITINLLGYHPRHGKTAAAMMELASADRMDSAVKFSDGNLRAGIWERNAKGTCKATIASAIIDDYAVDLRSFQTLKNQDKLALLFSRCDSTEEPWRQFKESILTGNADTDALISKSYGLAIMPVPQRIAATVENLNTARNNARAAAKSATNALQSWDASNSATSVGPLISAYEFGRLEAAYGAYCKKHTELCAKKEAIDAGIHANLKHLKLEHQNLLALKLMIDKDSSGTFTCPTCHYEHDGKSILIGVCEQLDNLAGRMASITATAANDTADLVKRIEAAGHEREAAEDRYTSAKSLKERTTKVELQSSMRQEKVKEADRAGRIADTLSEVCKVATAQMTELVDGAVRKLFTIGNHIWASVNDDSMICIEDGAIGFRRKGKFYTWECMSGRQELIATIGLQVALASGEGRGIVLIDEFGRLDSLSSSKVLLCLEHLIKAGDLAQVIIATPVPIMGVPKSATIITL
jgi:predicted ATPase